MEFKPKFSLVAFSIASWDQSVPREIKQIIYIKTQTYTLHPYPFIMHPYMHTCIIHTYNMVAVIVGF